MSDTIKLRQFGPAIASAALVSVTTATLWMLHAEMQPEHLIFGYLIPTTLIAVRYGSVTAMLASIVCSLCAAFLLYPPEFNFYIADPLNVVELGFFLVLCLATTQFVGRLSDGERKQDKADPGATTQSTTPQK